MRTKEVREW